MITAVQCRFKREQGSQWEYGLAITSEPGLSNVITIMPAQGKVACGCLNGRLGLSAAVDRWYAEVRGGRTPCIRRTVRKLKEDRVRKYIRTCQECGHKQEAKDPATYKARKESWRELKCKRCKSEAFDYGSWRDAGHEVPK